MRLVNIKRAIVVLMPALLLLLTGCSVGYTKDTTPEKPAPEFHLKNMDGQIVSLSDFRGKPVLINFWASWCDPCRKEMPYLQQVYDEWTGKGLVLLAIDIGETPAAINKFFTENNLSLPVLLDSDKQVGQEYGITGVPETFLIDKNGIIRKKKIGAYENKQAIENDLNLILR